MTRTKTHIKNESLREGTACPELYSGTKQAAFFVHYRLLRFARNEKRFCPVLSTTN